MEKPVPTTLPNKLKSFLKNIGLCAEEANYSLTEEEKKGLIEKWKKFKMEALNFLQNAGIKANHSDWEYKLYCFVKTHILGMHQSDRDSEKTGSVKKESFEGFRLSSFRSEDIDKVLIFLDNAGLWGWKTESKFGDDHQLEDSPKSDFEERNDGFKKLGGLYVSDILLGAKTLQLASRQSIKEAQKTLVQWLAYHHSQYEQWEVDERVNRPLTDAEIEDEFLPWLDLEQIAAQLVEIIYDAVKETLLNFASTGTRPENLQVLRNEGQEILEQAKALSQLTQEKLRGVELVEDLVNSVVAILGKVYLRGRDRKP